MKTIVAGDVGGTKTLLQRIGIDGRSRSILHEERYESGSYATFEELLSNFLRHDGKRLDAACFAVAGPVESGVAKLTNLPWRIAESELQRALSIPHLRVINDFYAVAHALDNLTRQDLVTINEGEADRDAPLAVLGAGTGLGEAVVVRFGSSSGRLTRVLASEGGHADYAPRNELQWELLVDLRRRYQHVSYERIVSGAGLANVYEFLRERERGASREQKLEVDPATVSRLASEGDSLALRAFELFVDVYGAEAGNLALKVLAKGGVYIAGGVAAKNVSQFTTGRFLEAFVDKGRFRELLEGYPVHLITNPKVGLMGAAELAASLAEQTVIPRS